MAGNQKGQRVYSNSKFVTASTKGPSFSSRSDFYCSFGCPGEFRAHNYLL